MTIKCSICHSQMYAGNICPNCSVDKPAKDATACSLIALAEKWESLAASWMQVARDRNDDAPDIANRAKARAAIYQDCAEDLKANADVDAPAP